MTPLPAPYAEDDWAAEITEDARGELNGEVTISDPNGPTTTYNPIAGTGGGKTLAPVITSRPARAQQLDKPREGSGADEWNAKRRWQIQTTIETGDPDIRKGFIATFAGGRDPILNTLKLQVVSARNSSHAAVRTILCEET